MLQLLLPRPERCSALTLCAPLREAAAHSRSEDMVTSRHTICGRRAAKESAQSSI